MSTQLVNPFDETERPKRDPAPRLESLEGKTVGLLDISKPGGKFYLDRLEELLVEKYQVGECFRLTKLTFTRPAEEEVVEQINGKPCHAVIEALAD